MGEGFLEKLDLFFNQVLSVVKGFGLADILDIILITFICYKMIQLVRETRAGQLIKGFLILLVCYFLADLFQMKTMMFLLQNLFQIGILALIVLFQPEIRRALEKVGRTKVANLNVFGGEGHERGLQVWEHAIGQMCEAAEKLGETKTGALIVIERQTRLGEQIDTGVELDAAISVELLLNIFFKNTPLHDGAVIVRDGKVLAAACFLPKPQKEEYIATNFGSRHRAAIGISEVSDAVTIVVSEETGVISVSEDGQLIRNFTRESLSAYLTEKLIPTKVADDAHKMNILRRALKK